MRRLGRRDVLRKAIAHFSKPDAELAYDHEEGTCAYRVGGEADSPQRCAIGVCIPDELYNSGMEGTGVVYMLPDHPEVSDLFTERALAGDFLLDVQRIHDTEAELTSSADPERVVKKLRDYARRTGIKL